MFSKYCRNHFCGETARLFNLWWIIPRLSSSILESTKSNFITLSKYWTTNNNKRKLFEWSLAYRWRCNSPNSPFKSLCQINVLSTRITVWNSFPQIEWCGAHKHFGVKQRRNFEPFVFIFFAHRHFSSCDGYKHSSSIMIRLRVGVEFSTEKVIIKINKQRDAFEFRLYL